LTQVRNISALSAERNFVTNHMDKFSLNLKYIAAVPCKVNLYKFIQMAC